MLNYSNSLGPAVRIGVLQHQQEMRLSLRGAYRVISSSGDPEIEAGAGISFQFSIASSRPAKLQYRLVFLKETSPELAEAAQLPSKEFGPLVTVKLGYTLGTVASTVEYWRCSRPFETQKEAEEARAALPQNERISILQERVEEPAGEIKMVWAGGEKVVADWVRFEPMNAQTGRVVVHDVIVGVGFHWQHEERQRFRGALEVRIDNRGLLTGVNELAAEEYLFSVNSSEMMSVMPEELLKAQTVAARNTLFATMGKHHYSDSFHLCADDHCQCYRGSSRETPDSRRVTLATVGDVLVFEGQVCDARYSKMCGGIMESFESVWNEDPRGYLPAGVDAPQGSDAHGWFPVTEETARAYIDARPDCWCNTTGDDVPPYLRYSAPYFRWEMRYPRAEVQEMLTRYFGREVGELLELVPLSRGASGRIEYLNVRTTQGEFTVGKEYQIRKMLAKKFLYSSCFVADYERAKDGSVELLILKGGGWGHGAGLCQVGATMMAYKGRGYKEILEHYYPFTQVVSPGTPLPPARADLVINHVESRVGEQCYEYYNCYAVADCPVYLDRVRFEAGTEGEEGVGFAQPAGTPGVDLEKLEIPCEFITFAGSKGNTKG